MNKAKTIILVGALALLVTAAVAVKMLFFPSVKDVYFAMNQQNLLRVPSGLVVLRLTHFPNSSRNGFIYASTQINGRGALRMMGRNVPLRIVLANAYDVNRARVVLPWDAPKGNFDFLITAPEKPRQQLQAAIRRKLGYVAQKETRSTDVLALKIVDASLPGLTVSGAGEKPGGNFKNGKIYLTHLRLAVLTDPFERALETPLVDKTGLTNFYDFSVTWNGRVQQQLQRPATARTAVDQILATWGLGLESDTASIEMLVVRKAG